MTEEEAEQILKLYNKLNNKIEQISSIVIERLSTLDDDLEEISLQLEKKIENALKAGLAKNE